MPCVHAAFGTANMGGSRPMQPITVVVGEAHAREPPGDARGHPGRVREPPDPLRYKLVYDHARSVAVFRSFVRALLAF